MCFLIIQKVILENLNTLPGKTDSNLSIKYLYEITVAKLDKKCTFRTCGCYLKKTKKKEKI